MKLVLVSFTLFYSATCALILSVINIVSHICAGYMCFVKLYSFKTKCSHVHKVFYYACTMLNAFLACQQNPN